MIQKLEPRHFGPDSGFGGATFSDVIDKVNEIIDAMNGKQKKQKPISSCDIVPYIDEKIAALQDMWREEKVSFDWDDMKDMIEDVARHFYHKEQKPSTGIYWHAIKSGEKLPCRAYIWNPDYEKYHDCWEGRLIPNLENISVGGDTWYLPADDVKNLPREGLDELQKEQKPVDDSDFKTKLAEYMMKNRTGYSYSISSESILELAKEELIKRGELKEQKPELVKHPPITFTFNSNASREERLKAALLALLNSDLLKVKEGGYFTKQDLIEWVERIPTDKPAWSEEDDDFINMLILHFNYLIDKGGDSVETYKSYREKLKSLRPGWKPTEKHLSALLAVFNDPDNIGSQTCQLALTDLYEQLKKL